jgi:osmotically-inducible protein OsmY
VRKTLAAGDKCYGYRNSTMRTSISSLILSVVLAGACFAQLAAKPVPTTKKITTAPARAASATSAQTDAQLEKEIRARFAASKIAEDKFEVHVQGGHATLTGNTNVLQHKGTATRLAHAAGVTDVINNIEPSEEARQKAAANLTKGRRRAQIKRSDTVARSQPR